MKKPFYLLLLLILFASCRTIHMSDLKPHTKNASLLPALEPIVDINSFESAYSMGFSTGTSTVYGTTITTPISVIEVANNNYTMIKDPRVQDAITIFDRDVKNNITDPYGEKKGHILCKIAASDSRSSGYGWSILSGLTLMIPNLFGMPFGSYSTHLDIDVEIFDMQNNLIRRYNSHGSNRSWVALYHGYSSSQTMPVSSVARVSNIEAFKKAMNDIKIQIEKDSNIIIKRLNR